MSTTTLDQTANEETKAIVAVFTRMAEEVSCRPNGVEALKDLLKAYGVSI